jgi:hypothetical protein
MDPDTKPLTASVQVVALARGLYLVSVKSAFPRRMGSEAEFVLPAIHVATGPGAPAGQMEIIPGPRNTGSWLYEARDAVVVKVMSGPANLVLTSVRTDDLPSIEVEVQKLDAAGPLAADNQEGAAESDVEPPPAPAPPPPLRAKGSASASAAKTPALRDAAGRTPLRTRVTLHIQNKGDVSFVDSFWAGALGERLAIESFSVLPLETLRGEDIEYKGLTENGVETDWVSGGGDCGSRGFATALAGFAVRPKRAAARLWDCEYRGSFSSGKIVGPVKNGAPCISEPGDRLEAMQLFIVPSLADGQSRPAPAEAPNRGAAKRLGPRFSVFRETAE